MRLFIAVSVPERVKDEIERAQTELRRALAKERVRWVGRAQFHLTLKFLGEVDPLRLEALTLALRPACEGIGALRLGAAGVFVIPELRRPRLIWVAVEEMQHRLAQLHRAVEAAAAQFTSEEPEPAFKGHITLARCKAIARPRIDLLATLAKAMVERPFGEWTAETIEVVRSELGPGGSRYTTLAAIPLAAPCDSSDAS